MDLKQLIYCINGEITPSELTLAAAKELSVQVPWANTLRQFYYVNLFKLDSPDYSKELTKGAILLSDRARFYQLTEGRQWEDWLRSWLIASMESTGAITGASQVESETVVGEAFPKSTIPSAIEQPRSASVIEQPATSVSQVPTLTMAVDYLKFLEQQPSINTSSEDKSDLIDHYLEYSTDSKSWMSLDEMNRTPKLLPQIKDDVELDESFFTETLAQIYIKQHRYTKALEIFKKLNLKYPEKSVYFASQIAQVESMIINNKQK